MKKTQTLILFEFVYLVLTIGISILILNKCFYIKSIAGFVGFDINAFTMSLPKWLAYLIIISFLLFMIHIVIEFKHKFSRNIPNRILVVSGLLTLFSFTLILSGLPFVIFGQKITYEGGYAFYPPVSAFGDETYNTNHNLRKSILITIASVQILIGIFLMYFSYCWGVSKKNTRASS